MSIEIAASGFARDPVAVMVQERGHALPKDISARECLQISLRHGIFSIYPGAYLIVLTDVILQLEIGIRHFDAELLIDQIHSPGWGIMKCRMLHSYIFPNGRLGCATAGRKSNSRQETEGRGGGTEGVRRG